MSLSVFRNRLFRVDVQDVKENRRQRKLARPYSKIENIIERLAETRPLPQPYLCHFQSQYLFHSHYHLLRMLLAEMPRCCGA